MRGHLFLSLLFGLLLASGCIAEKPVTTTPAPPSELELSSQVEEAIGIPEQATIPPKTTPSEISVPDFEVNATVDLGSVI